ncbi:MAG: uracil-DNA glycosylase [Pseudomonadota bacterium]
MIFDAECSRCPRLSRFLKEVKREYPEYHAAPVAPFGVDKPGLLIVGLAPGMHGANATGRPFTGDYAGILLYRTLHKFGFSNRPESISRTDGLKLKNCRITNAVKCLPPQNKPVGAEVNECNDYLAHEIAGLPKGGVIIALGNIAHQAVLRAQGLKVGGFKFAHGAVHVLPDGRRLVDSYHCSRYNTQTKRLTDEMFEDVFRTAKKLLENKRS